MVYQQFSHEADIGIKAEAASLEECFAEMAKAMFGVSVDVEKVRPREEVEVDAYGGDVPSLLVEYLNNLLYLRDVREMVFSEFEIESIEEGGGKAHLKGKAWGEAFDEEKHAYKLEVKAATFHQLQVEKTEKGWRAQLVLDV